MEAEFLSESIMKDGHWLLDPFAETVRRCAKLFLWQHFYFVIPESLRDSRHETEIAVVGNEDDEIVFALADRERHGDIRGLVSPHSCCHNVRTHLADPALG